MNAKTIAAALSAMSLTAFGIDGYSSWNPDGSGTWSEATRWRDGDKLPSETRNVYFNGDAWATDADYSILTSLVRMRFGNAATTFDMRFDEDHDGFFVNSFQPYNMSYPGTCTLVKSGTGRLVHSKPSNSFVIDRYHVTNGVLSLQFVNTNVVYGAYGAGVLEFDSAVYPVVARLDGDGFVTNRQSGTQLHFVGSGSGLPGKFYGTLAKNLDPTFNPGCVQYFMQTNYPRDLTIRFLGGTIGLACFGESGKSGSLGPGKKLGNFNNGHTTLVYLGGGETCDKTIALNDNAHSATFDAGGGNLNLSGSWTFPSVPRIIPITLTGTNAAPAVVSGPTYVGLNASNALAVVKRGSGTWRFVGSRDAVGSVSVEDGTLEYDRAAERGYASALGTANRCTEPIDDLYSNLGAVPWVQRLGTHSSTGAFVYVGADEAELLTRPFALRGAGRVRNDSPSVSVSYRGAASHDAAGGTLILDGAGLHDRFTDVTNGPGALAVEKVGSGTWTLGGAIALAGGVAVKEGTLRVSAPAAGSPYSWYRFTVRRTWSVSPDSSKNGIQLSQFGLFSADGEQQNTNLFETAETLGRSYLLAAGGCAWNHGVEIGGSGARPLVKLFLGKDGLMNANRTASGVMCYDPIPSDPSRWISWTMRLPANSKPVAFYDVKSQQGFQSGAMYNREPRDWTLEASVDGRDWHFVDERTDRSLTKGGCVWYSSDSKTFDAANPGYPIASAPAVTNSVSLGAVSVAAGASLVADGEVTLSAIRADVSSGGTIDGFSFAPSGALAVTGYAGAEIALPLTFANAKNLANLKRWTATQNGEPLRVQLRVSGSTVTLAPPGTVVIVR